MYHVSVCIHTTLVQSTQRRCKAQETGRDNKMKIQRIKVISHPHVRCQLRRIVTHRLWGRQQSSWAHHVFHGIFRLPSDSSRGKSNGHGSNQMLSWKKGFHSSPTYLWQVGGADLCRAKASKTTQNHSKCDQEGPRGPSHHSPGIPHGCGKGTLCVTAQESAQVLCPTLGTEKPRPLLASKVFLCGVAWRRPHWASTQCSLSWHTSRYSRVSGQTHVPKRLVVLVLKDGDNDRLNEKEMAEGRYS